MHLQLQQRSRLTYRVAVQSGGAGENPEEQKAGATVIVEQRSEELRRREICVRKWEKMRVTGAAEQPGRIFLLVSPDAANTPHFDGI